jgi:hypothetical protein
MTKGFSQYQQSQLGVSAAKARAISERSEAQFRTGLTAIQEKEALERAADQLEKIAKEAEKNARKRGRKVSFGRLIGGTLGFVLGGPAGKAALGTALGSLAGSAAAGGFKKYDVDVPDSLVPGGLFYGREREAFKERADDLEEAFEELTKQQRMNIGKNVVTDYLIGRGLGKLGEAKIGDLDVSLDDLLETGKISKKDYLVDILRSAAGGIGEDRLSTLQGLAGESTDKFVAGFQDPTELISKFASNQQSVDKAGQLKEFMYATQGISVDPKTGTPYDAFLEKNLNTPRGSRLEDQMKVLSQFEPDYIGANKIATPPPVQENISMFSGGFPNAFNKQNNVLAGTTGSDVIKEISNVTEQLSGEKERPGFSGVLKGFKREDVDFRDVFNPAGEETYFNIFPDELTDTDLFRNNNYGTNYGRYTGNRNSLFQSMVGPMGGI